MIYGTLFRAYGHLGRVRAYFYECMARFVFLSEVDIFVAAWSITDSFCCRYSRIFDGREDSLPVTVTYVPRCGLHFL